MLPKGLASLRQCIAVCGAALGVLAGCGDSERSVGFGLFENPTFSGGAVADEPRAVLVARDVLEAGGSAADAAVALYFTLAVTFPSTASLGGGGACLVYRPDEDEGDATEAIEFLPGAPSMSGTGGEPRNAVPGAVRGMYALQARYGRLTWSRLLAPAETYARLGQPISRALARDLARGGATLLGDPRGRALFGNDAGRPLQEGQRLVQFDLAAILTQLRVRGPGDFYTGGIARQLVKSVTEAGGSLTSEDLRTYRPMWRETVRFAFDPHTFHTAPPPAAGGVTAGAIFSALAEDDRYLDAGPDERAHLVAEAAMRAFADRSNWLDTGAMPAFDLPRMEASMQSYDAARSTPADALRPPPIRRLERPAATSFAVVDGRGMAVVCTVGMNNLFGTGRIAPGTGIILAASPQAAGGDAISFAPMLLVNHNTNQVFFAGGATGGATASSALATVMRGALLEERPLREAVAAPRLHHGGIPDVVVAEPELGQAALDTLAARGHTVSTVPKIGRVNAIHCAGGLPRSPETCEFENDRRAFGLATRGVF